MEFTKTIYYTYTRKELINAFWHSKGNYPLIGTFEFLAIDAIMLIPYIKNQMPNSPVFLVVLALFFFMALWGCIDAVKYTPKIITLLKAEQRIYLQDNFFYYESGDNIFCIEQKYIHSIQQTKNYYIIRIMVSTSDKEWANFILTPQIPRRAVLKMDMKVLAATLNVKYKDSRIWKS